MRVTREIDVLEKKIPPVERARKRERGRTINKSEGVEEEAELFIVLDRQGLLG